MKRFMMVFLLVASFAVVGCEDGKKGENGVMGLTGPSGMAGLNGEPGNDALADNQHFDIHDDSSVSICTDPYHNHDDGGKCVDENGCTADQSWDSDPDDDADTEDGECV